MYERNYHASVLKDDQPSKKKNARTISWKTVLLSSLCIVFVGVFITLIELDHFQIRSVTVVGVKSADPIEVSDFTLQTLEGKWLYIFPKTSIILLPDATLEKKIATTFPKFSSVSVTRSGVGRITVSVTEYDGVYLWCEEDRTECSFMSREGIVFAPAPFFSGNAYTKIFIGTQDSYPFQPITSEQLALMQTLTERLHGINIEASEFHFASEPARIAIVFYHANAPVKIIIDPTLDLETTLNSLFTTLRTETFSARFRNNTTVLEYIDITLPEKVLYKFK